MDVERSLKLPHKLDASDAANERARSSWLASDDAGRRRLQGFRGVRLGEAEDPGPNFEIVVGNVSNLPSHLIIYFNN